MNKGGIDNGQGSWCEGAMWRGCVGERERDADKTWLRGPWMGCSEGGVEWCADGSEVLKAGSHIEAPIGKKTDVSKTWLKGWWMGYCTFYIYGRYKRQWKDQPIGVKINRQRHKTDRQRYWVSLKSEGSTPTNMPRPSPIKCVRMRWGYQRKGAMGGSAVDSEGLKGGIYTNDLIKIFTI